MNSHGLSYFTSRFIGCCGPRKFGVGGLIQDFTISDLVDAAAEKFRVARRGSYALRNFSAARRHLDLTNDSRSHLQVAAGSAGSSNGN